MEEGIISDGFAVVSSGRSFTIMVFINVSTARIGCAEVNGKVVWIFFSLFYRYVQDVLILRFSCTIGGDGKVDRVSSGLNINRLKSAYSKIMIVHGLQMFIGNSKSVGSWTELAGSRLNTIFLDSSRDASPLF